MDVPTLNRTKTRCKRGHELSGANLMARVRVWWAKKPGRFVTYQQRQCRACDNLRRRKV